MSHVRSVVGSGKQTGRNKNYEQYNICNWCNYFAKKIT